VRERTVISMSSDDSPQKWIFKLIPMLMRSGAIPVRAISPSIRDPISQLVVEGLMVRGPSTVSGVARYVRLIKGASSRTTIRDRLIHLEENGTVCSGESRQQWMLSETFVRSTWAFLNQWTTQADSSFATTHDRSMNRKGPVRRRERVGRD
jgi:hypothetical protein